MSAPQQHHQPPAPRYLSAKELASEFAARGLRPCSYDAMLALIADCDESVGSQILLADAIEFLRAHKDWRWSGKSREKFRTNRKSRESPGIATL